MNKMDKRKAYNRAKKRVAEERGFYTHATVYVVMNIIIFIFKIQIGDYVNSERYNDFLPWNVVSTPVLWGIGLLGHGLWTFRHKNGLGKLFNRSIFSKEWEEKKIEEFMNKNNEL
ncbi:2TM domain-containing protein [Aquimarina litoralis]